MGRDEASYLEFVRARSPSLFRFALLLTGGDRFGAEDLLQTALARAYASWWRIKDAAAAEAYVRRILVNAEISDGRRKGRIREVLTADPPNQAGAHDHAARTGDRMDVWALLQRLSARQRAVVVLRFYEDLSEERIADVLGCSRGAVKSHMARALSQLRSMTPGAPAESPAESAVEAG